MTIFNRLPKIVFLLPALACCFANVSHAASIALKIDLTDHAKKTLVTPILKSATYKNQSQVIDPSTAHVTVAYLSGPTLTKGQAKKIAAALQTELASVLNNKSYYFSVGQVDSNQYIPGHTTLKPTPASQKDLKGLNKLMEDWFVKKGLPTTLPGVSLTFNTHTTQANYTPHITLRKGTTGPGRLGSMNKTVAAFKSRNSNKWLRFKLEKASVSVW